MKKIKLLAACFILALAIYIPNVHASEEDLNYLKNTMAEITSEKIILEGPIYDKYRPIYELDSRLYQGKYTGVSVDYNNSKCDNTKCKIVLTKNEETYTKENVNYYVFGLVTNIDRSIIFSVGDTLSIVAKVYDKNNVEYTDAKFSYHIDGLKFTNNTVKFTAPGVYKGFIESNDKNGELLYQEFVVFVGLQDYINTKLSSINSVNLDLGKNYETDISVFNNKVLDIIFGEETSSFSTSGSSVCETSSCNANINLSINDKNFTIKKDNISVTKSGIVFNVSNYKDLNKTEEYTSEYTSYSGDITSWTSSDTNVATVDANGKVTAVASGVSIITAKTASNVSGYYIVRVRPDDAYKNNFIADNDRMLLNVNFVVPTISSIINGNEDFVWGLLYNEANKLIENENYYYNVNDISNGKANLTLGRSYQIPYNNEIVSVDYCSTSEYDGNFDCGNVTRDINYKFVDQVSNSQYDSSLITPAKEVAKQLDGKYMVNFEISFKDYLNKPEYVSNYDFVESAKIGKKLTNPKDFEIGIDGRAGDSSFENASIMGYGLVMKNGITYAVSKSSISIERVLVVNGNISDSDETKIANISSQISKTLDSTDKVTVKINDDRSFNIVISKSNVSGTNQKISASTFSIKPLTSNSSARTTLLTATNDSIEFNTFVNFKSANYSVKPAAVSLKSAKENNNSIRLYWDAVENAEKYLIYRSTSKTKGYKKIKEVTTNEYTNTGLTYGMKYYYKVVSYNKTGSSKYSNIIYRTVVPNKVENLKFVSSNNSSIKLSFDKVSVSGYEVYRSTNNKSWSKVSTITKSTTLTYTNSKLSSNKKYYYKVRAYKVVKGKKIYGSFSSVVMMLTAPSTPKIKVSLNNYNALNVNVYATSGATKYIIYRSTSLKGTYTNIKELTTAGSFVENDLVTCTTYYYKVKSCNANGSCSTTSSIVNRKVTPKTPTMSVEAVSKKMNLVGFSYVDGASGYEIYRSTKKSSGYKKIGTSPIEAALMYGDTGKSNTTYYYKVRAYKLVGSTKVYSDFTACKKVKTK